MVILHTAATIRSKREIDRIYTYSKVAVRGDAVLQYLLAIEEQESGVRGVSRREASEREERSEGVVIANEVQQARSAGSAYHVFAVCLGGAQRLQFEPPPHSLARSLALCLLSPIHHFCR